MTQANTSLRDQISSATKDAMRAKDTTALATLRLVSAAIKDRDIAARADDRCEGISDDEIISLLAKMVKQREEAAKVYGENARPELASQERAEIEIVRRFMPAELSDDEMNNAVNAAVESLGATCLKDMGKVMGQLKGEFAGRMDMGKAGALVKTRLCS